MIMKASFLISFLFIVFAAGAQVKPRPMNQKELKDSAFKIYQLMTFHDSSAETFRKGNRPQWVYHRQQYDLWYAKAMKMLNDNNSSKRKQ